MTQIIVIDDDRNVLDHVVGVLKFTGYEVQGTQRAISGLHLTRQRQPDLVLCDITMPEITGFDVLAQLRENPQTADVPFIFLTARTEREDLRRGMELGADDYLFKPFSSDELIAAVNTQLEKRRVLTNKYESTINLLRKSISYALPHELRTPLSGSLGFAEVLRLDADILTPDEIRLYADYIIKHNQRLHRVIENFLVYAQIEITASDSQQIQALRNHITARAAKVIAEQAEFQALTAGRDADLHVDLEPIALRLPTENLVKIIDELVENAFKFSEPGSPVTVRARRQDAHYVVDIEDRGRGMQPDQIAAVGAYMQFERIFHEQQGLGLGLTIARRLVELHEGRLEIASQLGRGTTVSLRFPL